MEIRPMKLKDLVKVRDLEIDCIKEYFSATIENKWEELPQEWKDNLGASNRKSYQLYIESGLSFVAEEDGGKPIHEPDLEGKVRLEWER